jgi:hypothetical protein
MIHPLSADLRKCAAEMLMSPGHFQRAADELDRLYSAVAECIQKVEAAALENDQLKNDLLNSSVKAAEYEPVLRIIATGPRADGTYNYCREACQKLAQKALSHD